MGIFPCGCVGMSLLLALACCVLPRHIATTPVVPFRISDYYFPLFDFWCDGDFTPSFVRISMNWSTNSSCLVRTCTVLVSIKMHSKGQNCHSSFWMQCVSLVLGSLWMFQLCFFSFVLCCCHCVVSLLWAGLRTTTGHCRACTISIYNVHLSFMHLLYWILRSEVTMIKDGGFLKFLEKVEWVNKVE